MTRSPGPVRWRRFAARRDPHEAAPSDVPVAEDGPRDPSRSPVDSRLAHAVAWGMPVEYLYRTDDPDQPVS